MKDDQLALAQTVGLELELAATIAARDTAPAGGATAAALVETQSRFDLGREIGRGGMGRVLEANDRQFRRTVAIKEMLQGGGLQAKKRFLTEALVTGNLEHPGIPAVYERGDRADGSSYYAMQLVSGRTLAAALDEARTLEERVRLVPAIVKVAETVAYAHDRGVVHRDLKPENVLLGRHGQVFLLDWGIAKVRGLTASAANNETDGALTDGAKTQVGSVMGSPMYMAPEQARGDTEAIDERTDVFALGTMLYHVLTGRAPYQAKTVMALAAQAVEAKPPAVTELVSGVNPVLAAICAKAMQREPSERHRSALELAAALESFQSQGVRNTPSRLLSGVQNVGLAAVMLLAGVLLAFGMVGLYVIRHETAPFAFGGFLATLVGLTLAGVEYRTRGEAKLTGVGVAVATFTVLVAAFQLLMGTLNTLAALAVPGVSDDVPAFLHLAAQGLSEAMYAPFISLPLALAQAMVWALVSRRNAVDAIVPAKGLAP